MSKDKFTILLLTFWSLLFAKTVKAATLSEFMGGYDGQLLQWAAATALLGGLLRTILSLQSDTRVVRHIAVEAAWDALKALVAGMLAFVLIQALRGAGYAVPSEVRFAAILVAGVARMSAIDWMRNAGVAWLEARKAQIVGTDVSKKEQP
jgi:hypothetical protein